MSSNKMTLKFTRSDGKLFWVDGNPWSIISANGFDAPNIKLYTEDAAVGDGAIVTAARVGSREVEIKMSVTNPSLNSVQRRELTSYFASPALYTYDLTVYRDDGARYLAGCALESFEIPTENAYMRISATVELLCPEGYFRSVDNYGKDILGTTGMCGYPYIALQGIGRVYGIQTVSGQTTLTNDGDAESYCTIRLLATATITNPKIMVESNYIRLLGTMNVGDILRIYGESKTITLNGANVITKLDRLSDFGILTLPIGQTTISATNSTDPNAMEVYVYFNKRYMGA